MAEIIELRPHLNAKRTASDAPKPMASATILLFNGVRYETLTTDDADQAQAPVKHQLGRARKSR